LSKLKIVKAEIIALQEKSRTILEKLQNSGYMQLIDVEDDGMVKASTRSSVSALEKNIAVTDEALSILKSYAPKKKGMFSGREELTVAQFKEKASNTDEYLKSALEITSLQKEIIDLKAEIVRTQSALNFVKFWEPLDIPMKYKGTDTTAFFIGTLPGEWDDEKIALNFAENKPDIESVTVQTVNTSREQTAVVIACHKSEETEVYEYLRSIGFIYPSDPTRHPPAHRIKRLSGIIDDAEKKIAQNEKAIENKKSDYDKLEFLRDFLIIKKDKYLALENIGMTQSTVVIRGYIPENAIPKIEKILEKYDAVMTVTEPDADEDVPVLLKNTKFVAPMESVTEMYALPSKHDIDPASVMAFFYYVLFGMMLSDAGYGVVMLIATAIILKFTTVEGNLKKMVQMFFFCGISTTFWGALFGSWFGDVIPVIYTEFLGKPAPNVALWFDPIKDPVKLLIVSFIIGIFHLLLGVVTNGVVLWKNGKKLDALCDTIPIILSVVGGAPLAATVLISVPSMVTNIAKYVAIAGVILVVLTQGRSSKNILLRLGGGLYGLYNVASGYLSDILSYSRLLALGLATGSIAKVVNLMGTMPKGMPLKLIVFIVVFIIGHILNMAINVLGAYVHSNRLQFVELFSKFYEGGGKAFKPLNINTKYFKLKEENFNE
jgi:V/A-type H+-transporting ATPase subunit I